MMWLTDGRTDVQTDGQTDGRHTIIRPKFHFERIKIHNFGLSTLATAGNRTPKAEFLLKPAKMDHFI